MRYGLCTVADPISRPAPEKRESGFRRNEQTSTDGGTAEAAIQAHNQQLMDRTSSLLELPLVVLTEQRDHALRYLASAEQRADAARQQLVQEQDKFISFLMGEHEAKLSELRAECERLQHDVDTARSAAAAVQQEPSPATGAPSTSEIVALRQTLEAANNEVEETRAEALRLQEERDEAIRANDDLRVELMTELETARDETFQIETRLDEVNRLLEDARDQARDEAERFNEELAEVRGQLDERNEEVRRLRARLASHVTESNFSRPPPPLVNEELERAREESRQLRQQYIDTKRQLSRVTHELEALKGSPGQRRVQSADRSPAKKKFHPADAKGHERRRSTPLGFGESGDGNEP